VRLVGILMLVVGLAGAVRAVDRAYTARRPHDLAWATLAPAFVLLALLGLVTTAFPGFL
jgi:hypothetical protein